MTVYTVEANTGSSIWPVTSYETTPEVDAYLRSQTSFNPQISPGNAGMYCAPRFADSLVELMDADIVLADNEAVHAEAIRQMAKLVQLAATHHGAQISWSQAVA
jgi:hypothetical protein